jgi:hypothetical protein
MINSLEVEIIKYDYEEQFGSKYVNNNETATTIIRNET